MEGLYKYLIFLILVAACSTCIIPFETDITRYEDVLIIDGLLTDEPESTVIKLSKSIPIRLSNFRQHELQVKPDSGAIVFIIDDTGNVYDFNETAPGEYRASNPDFRGIIGRSYQLHVLTADEQTYESEFVTITDVPEIDSLYAEFGSRDGFDGMEYGFHIYIDSYDQENSTQYYRYDFEETWEFNVPYPSKYILENYVMIPRTEDVRQCWKTIPSTEIMIASTEKLETNIIEKYPIHFVSVETNHLSQRYSILVKQYSMSKEAYVFWDQLRISNQDQGSLFDSQAMQPIGNLCNTNDPEVPVLGYFEATSISKKRIFLTRWDIPQDMQPDIRVSTGYEDCSSKYYLVRANYFDRRRYTTGTCVVDYTAPNGLTIYIGLIQGFNCCDCTTAGSNIKPDFW